MGASHGHGPQCTPTLYYLTARSKTRTALLAGPFVSKAAAERHDRAARGFVARAPWADVDQFDVSVGVTALKSRGRPAPTARFHDLIVGGLEPPGTGSPAAVEA